MSESIMPGNDWRTQTVRSAMASDPVVYRLEDAILDILELFDGVLFEHLPICDHANNLRGIIAYKEFAAIRHMLEHLPEEDRESIYQKTAASIMQSPVLTIGPDAILEMATRIMLDNSIHALPVTENNHVIGILTSSDVLRAALQLD